MPCHAMPCRPEQAVLLLDGQGVRAGDGELVEEEQKLPEGLEEGPAGEQADALVGVDGPVGDELLLHGRQEAQLLLLPLAQLVHGVRLVELDRRAIHLQRVKGHQGSKVDGRVKVHSDIPHGIRGRKGRILTCKEQFSGDCKCFGSQQQTRALGWYQIGLGSGMFQNQMPTDSNLAWVI